MKKTLINAVIKNLGYDATDTNNADLRATLSDIVNHGISGGFGGFVYHVDTCKFYDDNKADILAMAHEMAQECGYSVSEMIAGFNCLKDYTAAEVEAFLLGLDDENETTFKNALAWFAAEEVARYIIEA